MKTYHPTDDVPPGLYWYSAPEWKEPIECEVERVEGVLVMFYRTGTASVAVDRLPDDATFMPR